jgi:hypothetical protein
LSKLISRPKTYDIAIRGKAKDRGALEMPIFKREL